MEDDLHVHAERSHGLCVLWITGELDTTVAAAFADHADEVVRTIPGPLLVNLSGLSFIDAHGGRTLAALLQAWATERPTDVCSCPPNVRRVLTLLKLPGDRSTVARATPVSETRQLADRVREARLDGKTATLAARGVMDLLTNTCIRLANTWERTSLTVEQGRQAVACNRITRERIAQCGTGRQAVHPALLHFAAAPRSKKPVPMNETGF